MFPNPIINVLTTYCQSNNKLVTYPKKTYNVTVPYETVKFKDVFELVSIPIIDINITDNLIITPKEEYSETYCLIQYINPNSEETLCGFYNHLKNSVYFPLYEENSIIGLYDVIIFIVCLKDDTYYYGTATTKYNFKQTLTTLPSDDTVPYSYTLSSSNNLESVNDVKKLEDTYSVKNPESVNDQDTSKDLKLPESSNGGSTNNKNKYNRNCRLNHKSSEYNRKRGLSLENYLGTFH